MEWMMKVCEEKIGEGKRIIDSFVILQQRN